MGDGLKTVRFDLSGSRSGMYDCSADGNGHAGDYVPASDAREIARQRDGLREACEAIVEGFGNVNWTNGKPRAAVNLVRAAIASCGATAGGAGGETRATSLEGR